MAESKDESVGETTALGSRISTITTSVAICSKGSSRWWWKEVERELLVFGVCDAQLSYLRLAYQKNIGTIFKNEKIIVYSEALRNHRLY